MDNSMFKGIAVLVLVGFVILSFLPLPSYSLNSARIDIDEVINRLHAKREEFINWIDDMLDRCYEKWIEDENIEKLLECVDSLPDDATDEDRARVIAETLGIDEILDCVSDEIRKVFGDFAGEIAPSWGDDSYMAEKIDEVIRNADVKEVVYGTAVAAAPWATLLVLSKVTKAVTIARGAMVVYSMGTVALSIASIFNPAFLIWLAIDVGATYGVSKYIDSEKKERIINLLSEVKSSLRNALVGALDQIVDGIEKKLKGRSSI